jgi:uncharacterized membrane protein YkoI
MKKLFYLLLLLSVANTSQADDKLEIARISLHEATQIILNQGNKRVLGASTEIIDGKEVHIIKVLTPDGHIIHYKIDAETGALIN